MPEGNVVALEILERAQRWEKNAQVAEKRAQRASVNSYLDVAAALRKDARCFRALARREREQAQQVRA